MGAKDEQEKLQFAWLFKLGDKIADSFVERMPAFIQRMFQEGEKNAPKPDKKAWDRWCDKLVVDGFCDQDTANLLKPLPEYPFPIGGLFWVMTLLKTTMADLETVLQIYSLDRQYSNMAKTTPHPAPIDNLVRSMIIDPKRSSENRAQLKRHGFDDTQIDNIILSYYRIYDEGMVRDCYLRGIINSERMYERMRELGYTDQRTSEIIQTWVQLPPPGDLLMMVAKEAFEPDLYKKLGLHEEFPTDQLEWLRKQGISDELAMKYWIAHWDQPSIGQGFEMLHRGVITKDDLDLLFRAVEIPRFWREKLMEISYLPYTRVDTRRMHEMGVLDTEELVKAYMAQGYDPEHAAKMAEFTIRYNADTEKQLTRSAILESYREDLISRKDAINLLTAQDYSEDLADYYLSLEDYKRDKEIQGMYIDVIQDRYLVGLSSESETRSDLNKLGMRGAKIDALMDNLNLYKYKYDQIPSRSDLDRFLVKGIIDEGQYRSLMSRHGYSSLYTSWYVEELRGEITQGGRAPTKTDLDNWLKRKHITEDEYRIEMKALGFNERYINLYLK